MDDLERWRRELAQVSWELTLHRQLAAHARQRAQEIREETAQTVARSQAAVDTSRRHLAERGSEPQPDLP